MFVTSDAVKPFDSHGIAIRDYTASSDAASSVATLAVPPGALHPTAYSTKSEKFYFAIYGSVEFIVDGSSMELGAGDLCHVPVGVHFSYENVSKHPAVLMLVHTPGYDPENEVLV